MWIFEKGDEVICECMHGGFSYHKVIRTTKTMAFLDSGYKLPISGGDGCMAKWTYQNQHGRHMYAYYLKDTLLGLKKAEVEQLRPRVGAVGEDHNQRWLKARIIILEEFLNKHNVK